MGYLKKKYRILIEEINKKLKLPKDWYRFVNKEKQKNNFIIKTNGICTCNNCKTQFKSKKKINEIEQCPKCKNMYQIKRKTYKRHTFYKRLVLLDNVKKKWVIRLFEFQTYYLNGKIEHTRVAEYGRIILQDNLHIVNNRLISYSRGYYSVKYYEKIKKWRPFRNGELSAVGKLYSKNLLNLLKNTKYKYSQLWVLADKEDNVDIKYHLRKNFKCTENLIKMGLYKLALDPENFEIEGSFKERFGVDKTFYKFMKENNISENELEALKLYKEKNIDDIKFLSKFGTHNLEEIREYTNLKKFIRYAKCLKDFNVDTYVDYLRFIEDLGFNLKSNKYLFPKDLKEKHDEYLAQIDIKKDPKLEKRLNERYQKLKKFTFADKSYIIRPAYGIQDLQIESSQQDNCIRSYAKRYSEGDCDIYFMRTVENPNQSLVTVEVRDKKVVQSYRKSNKDISKIEERFLKKWENDILRAA